MSEEVLFGHDNRIACRTGLFEATIGLAKQTLQRGGHVGKRRRIDHNARGDAATRHSRGKSKFKIARAITFEYSTGVDLVWKAERLHVNFSIDGIAIGPGGR